MVNQELQEYVAAQKAAGISTDDLRKALLGSGWPEDQVDEVLGNASSADDGPPMAAEMPSSASQEMQKVVKVRSKRLVFLVIGIVVVLLIIGGIAAYFVYQSMSAPTFGQ